MRKHRLILSTVAAVCLALGGLAQSATVISAQPVAAAAPACRLEKPGGLPNWIVEGVWRNERTMVVFDVPNRRPVEVTSSGVAIRQASDLADYFKGRRQVGIRRGILSPGGRPQALAELAGGRVVPLDRFFVPLRSVDFALDGRRGGHDGKDRIGMLHDWVLVDGDVVGYADIEGPGETILRWKNGFVRFSLGDPAGFQTFREQSYPDPLRPSFRLTYPLLAGHGGAAYAVLLSGDMGLWKLGRGAEDMEQLHAFPAHLRGRTGPNLWDWAAPEELPQLMQEVERATMPTGLYAWGDALFLVSRSFENGLRTWRLSKIDPVRDQVLWTVPIDSSARHLTVVPGPREWAFFEKGPVTALFHQRTDRILFVDSLRMKASRLKSLCS